MRDRHNLNYDFLINRLLRDPDDIQAKKALLQYRGMPSALSRSVLNFFRNVRGARAERLCELISGSNLEVRIIKATRQGTRGYRMRALQILSYLATESSLQIIRDHLYSNNRYERLTAARALTRRKSRGDFALIIGSLAAAFPKRTDLLAEVILGFGSDIQPALEDVFQQSERTRVRVVCLEALKRLAPARTALNLSQLMEDPSDEVRAAAISLSAISLHSGETDLLLRGLADEAISVKISSAKVAAEHARPDAAPHLYKLTRDPSFWVRYWATRALWGLGRTGRQMVTAIARSDDPASDMAENVSLEMEATHA